MAKIEKNAIRTVFNGTDSPQDNTSSSKESRLDRRSTQLPSSVTDVVAALRNEEAHAPAVPTPRDHDGFSGKELQAIANEVRPCWGIDAGAPGVQRFSVLLKVTTDSSGVVRSVGIAPKDREKLTDPLFAAFADRAVEAVRNSMCAALPLPARMLGRPRTFVFRYRP
jgi:hypothetical protein